MQQAQDFRFSDQFVLPVIRDGIQCLTGRGLRRNLAFTPAARHAGVDQRRQKRANR